MFSQRMDRRDFMRIAAATGLTGTLPGSLFAQPGAANRPNIVLIMADDLGYECIGANGGRSYNTPVIDKLAREGARFNHCHSQPLCTPSRVQIMTGMYNVRNYTGFGKLHRSQTTFAHLLKARGYATAIAGKWQLGDKPDDAQHFGFNASCLWQQTQGRTDQQKHDTRYPNPRLDINGETQQFDGAYGPDVCTEFLCKFMEENRTKPFFAYYPMILPHCPFAPTPDSPEYNPANRGSRRYKGNPKYFGDMVTYMDKLVGRIVDKLEALGLRDNTLVVFTGDNGTDEPIVSQLGDREWAGGKGSMTDAGTHVPLIANWPGKIDRGVTRDDLVDFSDFLPTFCDLAGEPIPDTLPIDGRSFLPQLLGKEGDPRQWIYCWYENKRGKTQAWARNRQYKLYDTGELYDVPADPLERQPIQNPSPDVQRAHAMLQPVLDHYVKAHRSALG
ncbi:MAG: sulfatase-like hydrolase/transferase [Phycisphaeraceae bacterium]